MFYFGERNTGENLITFTFSMLYRDGKILKIIFFKLFKLITYL